MVHLSELTPLTTQPDAFTHFQYSVLEWSAWVCFFFVNPIISLNAPGGSLLTGTFEQTLLFSEAVFCKANNQPPICFRNLRFHIGDFLKPGPT
jgi:hypothetical protein